VLLQSHLYPEPAPLTPVQNEQYDKPCCARSGQLAVPSRENTDRRPLLLVCSRPLGIPPFVAGAQKLTQCPCCCVSSLSCLRPAELSPAQRAAAASAGHALCRKLPIVTLPCDPLPPRLGCPCPASCFAAAWIIAADQPWRRGGPRALSPAEVRTSRRAAGRRLRRRPLRPAGRPEGTPSSF